MTDGVDLLVVAAHPDDAELAMGGTLLLAAHLGYRTGILDLTRGELSSRGDPETRARETERATEILGLAWRGNLGERDGDVRDTAEARTRFAEIIRALRPRVVLAPWREDLHPDHAGAGELVTRAWYLCGVEKFTRGKSPYRPGLLAYYMCHTPFIPTIVVDISPFWNRKLEAIRAYGSQFLRSRAEGPPTKVSRPDFLQAVEGRAREYGLQVEVSFGEPLCWVTPPAISDPVGFLGMPAAGSPGSGCDGEEGR
ncbi:MAG: bacillithiol biosynthesis deacetylase BshB1 [Planctomycetota bacterium]